MASSPLKIVRFLVWLSADREQKEDVLVTFDERFQEVCAEFGPAYAHWWSVSQALRSMPYRIMAIFIRIIIWSVAK